MRVTVDMDLCESHGVCVGIAPDIFEIDDDDVNHVLVEAPDPSRYDALRSAAISCPKQAILLEE